MNAPDKSWWDRARRARHQLATLILSHPNVSLIDIGEDPAGQSSTPVLRVHIRQGDALDLNLPQEMDGIPIRVIPGRDYKVQKGPS